MKVIYWDVVSPDEIGRVEFRKEIEIADGLIGSEAAIAASEKVDALDFPGPSIGEVATNHFEVAGFLYRVDKEVVVRRSWKPCGEAPPRSFGPTALSVSWMETGTGREKGSEGRKTKGAEQ